MVQKFLFLVKRGIFYEFQSGRKSRFQNPLPSRGTCQKRMSSVIHDIKPGLWASLCPPSRFINIHVPTPSKNIFGLDSNKSLLTWAVIESTITYSPGSWWNGELVGSWVGNVVFSGRVYSGNGGRSLGSSVVWRGTRTGGSTETHRANMYIMCNNICEYMCNNELFLQKELCPLIHVGWELWAKLLSLVFIFVTIINFCMYVS